MPRQKSQSKPVCIPARLDFEFRVGFAVPNTLGQTHRPVLEQEMRESCQVVSLDHAFLDCAVNIVTGINLRVGACSSEQAGVLNKGEAIVLA